MALDLSHYNTIGESYANCRKLSDFPVNMLQLICNTNLIFFTMLKISQSPVSSNRSEIKNYCERLHQKFYLMGPLFRMGIYLFSINITLITICNMSIINPGPKATRIPLTVFYNNVHGLINARDLASDHPPLNMTKIHELHGFLFSNKPDVVILNETWLKKSIKDHEVLPNNYKVFKLDRSLDTHPWDPNHPEKFRKNGGGVLIAHRNDLDISSSKITITKAKTELLSLMFRLNNGKNLCISTFYRVGTLRDENFREFSSYFKVLATKKKIDRHLLIGDLNLNNVTWPEGETSCSVQNSFIEFLIRDLGHTQMIDKPTHCAGNTLDLLFTNVPHIINDLKVMDHNEACPSDHFGISLKIRFPIARLKGPKKKMYDYKKANWKNLNFDLKQLDWDNLIGSLDPHIAWPRFKLLFKSLCDRHIPKRNVKSQFQPPWYDTDCDKIRREKERWRKRFKETGSQSDLNKFRDCRKKFKHTMSEKMKLNVVDSSDAALISKKFWRHVKSQSKCTRIPETIKSGDRFRSKAIDKANLFNEYFYSQFSEGSSYEIDIEMNKNAKGFMDLRFHVVDVLLILKELNPSKAAGPDGIDGIILKNCAASIAKPLTLLFNTSFVTGCIPGEWKLASVVPVHKKGGKGCVENYRPMSLTCLVMKVFERCIQRELYATCADLLDARQHGFLNEKSCTTQMVPFIDDLSSAMNSKIRSDIIYFDFAKAFDSVSHDLILHKLKKNYGVDGLMLGFVKSYLQGKQQ